jgi:putative membrane-bound dehydrogenase-like protein
MHQLFTKNRVGLIALILFISTVVPAALARAAEVKVDGKTFTVPDGFTVERVAGPGLVDRPVVASFDEQGRLYVADSSGSSENVKKQLEEKPHRIVRLEDTDGDGRFDKTVVFADKMMFTEGAMWLNGSLYVSAPPSIWKLTDTDNDGVADRREEWHQGKTLTGCANDLHGPYAGPDGWIYWCKGAFAEQTYDRPGHKPFVTKASHIFRKRPDGSAAPGSGVVEPVMTGGMDNPVDVVFTPGGERIFSCTFLQNPAGGKRDGLIHAVYGGVYGKVHDVLDNHPRTGPDVMPVLSHLGPAAACGLTRYESDAFGPAYRDNLFCTLFNMHKVTRHVLTPAGATFKSKDEDFLVCDSLDFHPTDVIEDADGSLLVIDTGGWYKLCCPTSQLNKPDVLGAIYRVRRTGAPKIADPRGLKLDWKAAPEKLILLLDDARPAVRGRAIAELGARGPAAIPAIRQAIKDLEVTGRTNAVWAATRIDHPDARAAVRAAIEDGTEQVACAALHSVSVWRDREAAAELLWMYKRPGDNLHRAMAEATGRVGDKRHVGPLLRAAGQTKDPILFHSYTYAVMEIADPAATAVALNDSDSGVRRAALIALDQMEGGTLAPDAVAAALKSPDAALRDTAAWVAGRHPEWGGALAGAFAERLRQPETSPQAREELRQQLSRLAKSEPIQKLLADRLSAESASEAERRLVLATMAGAELEAAPQSWVDGIVKVLAAQNPALIADAVSALRRLPMPKEKAASVSAPLMRVAQRDDVPANVRVEALAAVPKESLALTPELFAFVASQVSPDQPVSVRVTAADVLGRARLTRQQLASLADAVKTAGPLEIGRLLGAYDQSSDEEAGLKLVAALASSKAAKALRADMVTPRLAKFSPTVRKAAEPLLASLNPDAGAQRQKLEQLVSSLPTGDVRKGQLVFNSKQAACSTCHAIGYIGGHVGPDLTRIGSTRAERDLLESIVFPSASFVQSYEPVLVDTRAGDRQSGILKKNDADEVVLITGPDQETHIPRKDVAEMRPSPVSVMPAGLDQQLSQQDLADLVAFLKACQ